eukprot:gene2816-40_t
MSLLAKKQAPADAAQVQLTQWGAVLATIDHRRLLIVAIRGSKAVNDWMQNIAFEPHLFDDGLGMHGGVFTKSSNLRREVCRKLGPEGR